MPRLMWALALAAATGAAVAPAAAQSAGDPEPVSADEGPDTSHAPAPAAAIRYFIEEIQVTGNRRTKDRAVRRFVPLEPGDVLDVDDPAIESIRWQLLGTGWFDQVRLRLERGSKRGWVVLVVEVEERNTIVIEQLMFGVSEGINSARAADSRIVPYGGFSLAETNLLGLGMSLSLTGLFSQPQQGVRLRFTDPMAFGTNFLLSSSAFFTNARQFFGIDPLVSFRCDLPPEECPSAEDVNRAVVFYRRAGFSLGTGNDLGASTRYTLDWQAEWVNVRARPEAASTKFGTEIRPIDFAIQNGTSWVSLIRFGLDYDRRNDPGLPTKGVLARFQGDGATRIIGSNYDFLRLQGLFRSWHPLPQNNFVPHYLRFGVYGGVIFGEAPFFYKFHVSDLTDLIPSRVLEMELDARPPPNLMNTSIAVMRAEDLAGRVDVEYGLHVWHGTGGLRTVSIYGVVGMYALASFDDVSEAVPGFTGAARLPVDFTFDLGIRLDTTVGVFQFGFSTMLGFIAL